MSTIGTSPVQATRDVASFTAIQPVEAPGARMKTTTQPVEAPGVRITTQSVGAPIARPVVHPKATGASSEEVQATKPVEQSLTGKKTLPPVAAASVSAHLDMDF